MNPDYKVLTNAKESNLHAPLIQNRFRKLTLQSPKQQSHVQLNLPERVPPPQSKLATENPPVSPYKSQNQTITNKLMLSTSSGNNTEQTNFINVETEPFTNPLQIESTEIERITNPVQVKNAENEKESPENNSGSSDKHKELALQMEKLEVSRVSADLFSQFSSVSKLSLPPNRLLSNKENVDNLSQQMSNIHMSDHDDLADTQPNTSSQYEGKLENFDVETQPPIILISDGEEDNASDTNKSLLTEESEDDDSVIEVLSSDDSREITEDQIPHNVSPIITQADDVELTESVAQKLNHFFDNIPKLDASLNNYHKIDSKKNESIDLDISIPETAESHKENHNEKVDESNVLQLQASQLDEDLDESGTQSKDKNTSQVGSIHQNDDNQKNETLNRTSGKQDEASIHHTRLDESDKTNAKDNESESQSLQNESRSLQNESQSLQNESQSLQNESSNSSSEPLNQSTDDRQISIRETKKSVESEKIKTTVFRVNSPIINISARVNINIQVSGFSSTSSETDGTSENTDDQCSIHSSRNNESFLSEADNNSSREVVAHCRNAVNNIAGSNPKNFVDASPNHKIIEGDDDDDDDDETPGHKNDDSPEPSIIESSIAPGHKNDDSPESSVIESSILQPHQADQVVDDENEEHNTSAICESMTSLQIIERESIDTSNSSKKSMDCTSDSSSNHKESMHIEGDESKIDENNVSVLPDENNVSALPVDSSVEIDEIGENLLNDIYGDIWRTPQLIKKCVSTKKKNLTEVTKRNDGSLRFSFFQRDIPDDLESTRITPCGGTQKLLDQSQRKLSPRSEINESDANQSSRIIRSCRKVAPNRILDYSDDDDDGDNQSNSSFEPVVSDSGEESDDSQKIVKPKPTQRKRNQFVFLDLTCQEVIEDEDHENPDATSDELEKVGKAFLEALQTKTNVETPAPVKKSNVPSTTTKRKLFTPNYDDQKPFEEMKTPERILSENNNNRTIQLKTPIPSFLIPTQFRDKAKVDGEPFTPKNVVPSKSLKKLQTPRTPAPVPVCGFMESLDDKLIPVEHCDPDALKFRSKFKANKVELVKRLMKIFNHYIFDNKLLDVPVTWNKKLTKTAGITRLRKRGGVRIAPIEMSEKVCTSADRLRDTLIHECCHAAAWIVDGDSGGHGKIWKYWADRSNKRFPELPAIGRCHNYDIAYKYTYKCAICGLKSQAHSKSRKVENIRCAKCHGPIELFVNKTEIDGTVTLVPPKEPSMFAKYVKENYKLHKVSGSEHADVMKILSNNFGKLTVLEKMKFKN